MCLWVCHQDSELPVVPPLRRGRWTGMTCPSPACPQTAGDFYKPSNKIQVTCSLWFAVLRVFRSVRRPVRGVPRRAACQFPPSSDLVHTRLCIFYLFFLSQQRRITEICQFWKHFHYYFPFLEFFSVWRHAIKTFIRQKTNKSIVIHWHRWV